MPHMKHFMMISAFSGEPYGVRHLLKHIHSDQQQRKLRIGIKKRKLRIGIKKRTPKIIKIMILGLSFFTSFPLLRFQMADSLSHGAHGAVDTPASRFKQQHGDQTQNRGG